MTLIFPNQDERVNGLCLKTLEEIRLHLVGWPYAKPENRIKMIESDIEKYHTKRKLLTHRRSGPELAKYSIRTYKMKRLVNENTRLRKELAVKNRAWWKFW